MGRTRPQPGPGDLPTASRVALRSPVVRRLLDLREQGLLTMVQVRAVAGALAVSERTVWRWLAQARDDPRSVVAPGARTASPQRFTVTEEVRRLLALWKGNVAAVRRELVARRAGPSAEAATGDQAQQSAGPVACSPPAARRPPCPCRR